MILRFSAQSIRQPMSGGQHRDDEANGPSQSGERETGRSRIVRAINQALLCKRTGMLGKSKN